MAQQWTWFHGDAEDAVVRKKAHHHPPPMDYHRVARDAKKALEAVRSDPSRLSHVVDDETEETYFFIDLLVANRTIRERDLLEIDGVDWRFLSNRVPLSRTALERFEHAVDWDAVSADTNVVKDAAFLRRFRDRIRWASVTKLHLDPTEDAATIAELADDGVLPIDACCLNPRIRPNRMLGLGSVAGFATAEHADAILLMYGAPDVERTMGHLVAHASPGWFIEACINAKHVPATPDGIAALVAAPPIETFDWRRFLTACRPDEAFVSAHVAPTACRGTWRALSSDKVGRSTEFLDRFADKLDWAAVFLHHPGPLPQRLFDAAAIDDPKVATALSRGQRLTPEFIERRAATLDWYELCEHQELPEGLMRAHAGRLNWWQVSRHQRLSAAFVRDFKTHLDAIKMAQNDKVSQGALAWMHR